MKSIKHVWWTLIGHRKDIDLPQTRMDIIQSPHQSYSQGVVSFELWKSLFVIIMFLDTSQNRGHFDAITSTQKHMSGTKENKNTRINLNKQQERSMKQNGTPGNKKHNQKKTKTTGKQDN